MFAFENKLFAITGRFYARYGNFMSHVYIDISSACRDGCYFWHYLECRVSGTPTRLKMRSEFAAAALCNGRYILKGIYRSLISRVKARRRRTALKWEWIFKSIFIGHAERENLFRLLCKIATVTSKFPHFTDECFFRRTFGCEHIIYLPQLLTSSYGECRAILLRYFAQS